MLIAALQQLALVQRPAMTNRKMSHQTTRIHQKLATCLMILTVIKTLFLSEFVAERKLNAVDMEKV